MEKLMKNNLIVIVETWQGVLQKIKIFKINVYDMKKYERDIAKVENYYKEWIKQLSNPSDEEIDIALTEGYYEHGNTVISLYHVQEDEIFSL